MGFRITSVGSRWVIFLAVFVCVAGLSGCDAQSNGGGGAGEGPGHRKQALALTPKQEAKLGEEAFQEVLAKSDVVSPSDPRSVRVRTVAENIFTVALTNELLQKEINLHVQGWDWDHRKDAVLRKEEVNAFCLPGGKVCVYTGILELMGKNDDWLATVLGHEIAHALAHHASERIARQEMYQSAMDAQGGFGGLDSGDRTKLMGLLGIGTQMKELAFERQQESEADHIGIFLMTFAGYHPEEAPRFWEEMENRSGGHTSRPEILSDHPSDARRVAQLRGWAVHAADAYRAWNARGSTRPNRPSTPERQ